MTSYNDCKWYVYQNFESGAGVAIILGAILRPRFPDLRVFAYATPAGLVSREAARYTESYAFTVGIGDDFVMRLGVESTENLRTSILETIRACKLPKVSFIASLDIGKEFNCFCLLNSTE